MITKRDPRTVHLAGPITYINHLLAIEAITPGMILEYRNDGGVLKLGVHDTADDPVNALVALEQDHENFGVDDAYAAGDLVLAGDLGKGALFWGILPSGQNIAPGARLQSNGDGRLKALGTGVAFAVAEEGTGGAVTVDTRIRAKVI